MSAGALVGSSEHFTAVMDYILPLSLCTARARATARSAELQRLQGKSFRLRVRADKMLTGQRAEFARTVALTHKHTRTWLTAL